MVLLVAGNHEYYGGEIHATNAEILRLSQQFKNVFFLQRSRIDLEGTKMAIIGATFWTSIPESPKEVRLFANVVSYCLTQTGV
jgi:hypothetical protein